ncbi:MAG: hypothetical protein QOI15_1108 [Pseudonocardiales bacterium]|jgi:uncharacterized membrane protein YcaP (DUF421 family)|nr:hypothetical protein [Pseudonocardiales bacterium]MDT4941207.1 hypothetical protein [Pseudonocardiales bacterium]
MVELLGVSWRVAGSVVIATVAMYLLLILLVRLVGQRSLLGMTSLDLGCVVALGAVIGRTTLLATPTLLAGIIALTTLFAMQTLFRALGTGPLGRSLNRSPVVLMDGGVHLADNMRRARVTEADVRQALRLNGVTQLSQVRYVVMERNGAISVLRGDGAVDPQLVADLRLAPADAR